MKTLSFIIISLLLSINIINAQYNSNDYMDTMLELDYDIQKDNSFTLSEISLSISTTCIFISSSFLVLNDDAYMKWIPTINFINNVGLAALGVAIIGLYIDLTKIHYFNTSFKLKQYQSLNASTSNNTGYGLSLTINF